MSLLTLSFTALIRLGSSPTAISVMREFLSSSQPMSATNIAMDWILFTQKTQLSCLIPSSFSTARKRTQSHRILSKGYSSCATFASTLSTFHWGSFTNRGWRKLHNGVKTASKRIRGQGTLASASTAKDPSSNPCTGTGCWDTTLTKGATSAELSKGLS